MYNTIEKINGCKNDPANSSISKVSKYIPSGFLMATILSFRSIGTNHDVYRGKVYSSNRKIYQKLKENHFNTFTFPNHDNNKFLLLLEKDIYPYEYMDD